MNKFHINKKFRYYIKLQPILEEEFEEQKDIIWNLINKGLSEDFLNKIDKYFHRYK